MLSCARYRVTFEALEELDLPGYLGSTLRGAFGHAFRSVACPAPRGMDCPIPAQCPYHLIFETSPPPGSQALRTHEEIPRPFVISSGDSIPLGIGQHRRQQFGPGDEVSFELVLVGRAQDFFPYFVVALREVDRIGRRRRAVELKRIEAASAQRPSDRVAENLNARSQGSVDSSPPPDKGEAGRGLSDSVIDSPVGGQSAIIYDASDNLVCGPAPSITLEDCLIVPPTRGPLTIEFLTQTRLKHEGRFARRPEFQILFRRLLGRLSSLSRFHCGEPLDVNFRELIDSAASIRLTTDNTQWTRWERFSSRQDRRIEWEGLVGGATYEGDVSPFWKFLKFGEFVHVGHGATFGLGKIQIDPAT